MMSAFSIFVKIEKYLSIHPIRDVIELPISDQLDIVGWDFRKALQLLQRSNSRLLEWISSPVVYIPPYAVVEELWRLAPAYFSPLACGKHYYQTARHYFSLAVKDERIQVKAMFYALRTLLAVNWIEKIGSPVPMDFWVSAERILTIIRDQRGDSAALCCQKPYLRTSTNRYLSQSLKHSVRRRSAGSRRSYRTLNTASGRMNR